MIKKIIEIIIKNKFKSFIILSSIFYFILEINKYNSKLNAQMFIFGIFTEIFSILFFSYSAYWILYNIYIGLKNEFIKMKKSFLNILIIFTFLAINTLAFIFVLLIFLNSYVDKAVPIRFGFDKKIEKYSENEIRIEGTWTSFEEDSIFVKPMNMTKIICYREFLRCQETLVNVNSFGLTIDTNEYEILTWNDSNIIYQSKNGSCFNNIYSVDLITKNVNGIEKSVCNKVDGYIYKLESGSKIYNDLRLEARPYLLRIMLSFFGI
jgi:hypothetical protein